MGREPDLTKHVMFLRDVIKIKDEIDPGFRVFTQGPWHSIPQLKRVRWFEGNTGGYPRGVIVMNGEIYILITPIVVDGVPFDEEPDSGVPLCLIEEKREEFKQAPALLLEDIKGESWKKAWERAAEHWRKQGKEVPDFTLFLGE